MVLIGIHELNKTFSWICYFAHFQNHMERVQWMYVMNLLSNSMDILDKF